MYEGREVIGIRLNWDKRYITLAPIATVLGLAFKLYDPDHLIGDVDDYGITAALIPVTLPGVEIGRRHFPINIPFQNGPTRGRDVFVPIDAIIGGAKMAGQGWRMLVRAALRRPQHRRCRATRSAARNGRRVCVRRLRALAPPVRPADR